jgi:hypothetical protein
MDIRYNINALHSELCSQFSDVTISEKTNKMIGNFIEISVNEKYQVKMIIPVKNLVTENVTWFYYTNPVNESDLIEKNSNIRSTSHIVKDIINNKRFDSEYVSSIN